MKDHERHKNIARDSLCSKRSLAHPVPEKRRRATGLGFFAPIPHAASPPLAAAPFQRFGGEGQGEEAVGLERGLLFSPKLSSGGGEGEAVGQQKQKLLPVIRTDAGGFFGFGEHDGPKFDNYKGRFAQIIPPTKPATEHQKLAKAMLAAMGITEQSLKNKPKWN